MDDAETLQSEYAWGHDVSVRQRTVDWQMWGYEPLTGEFSLEPLFTITGINNDPASPFPDFQGIYFGIDQITLSPDGAKLYVPQPDSIDVYDATTGAKISSMTDDSRRSRVGSQSG